MIVRSHKGAGRDPRVFKEPPTLKPGLESQSFTIRGDPANQEAAAYSGGKAVGFMDYDEPHEHIGTVFVSPQFRGYGAATRMYLAAGQPTHSPNLTEEGEGFAGSTGGEVPKNISREPPLNEAGHIAELPTAAGYIDELATRTARFTGIRPRQ